MKRYVKAEKIMAGSMEPDYIEDRDDLASVLENKFYEWTGVKFTIDSDELDYFSVRNWVSTDNGWFRLRAVYNDFTDEMAKRYFDNSTPILNQMVADDNFIFNPYSDIEVENSDDLKYWYDGLTFDYQLDEGEDGWIDPYDGFNTTLEEETDIVGQKIIDILYGHKDDIVSIMKDYIVPEDEYEYY